MNSFCYFGYRINPEYCSNEQVDVTDNHELSVHVSFVSQPLVTAVHQSMPNSFDGFKRII